MSETPAAALQFNKFLVKESYFAFHSPGDYDLELVITPAGVVFPATNQFQLQLTLEATDRERRIEIRVTALADFSYTDIDDVLNSPFFLQNAPALLFPYLRAYISTLTTQSGIVSVVLPTLNLQSLADLLRQNTQVDNGAIPV